MLYEVITLHPAGRVVAGQSQCAGRHAGRQAERRDRDLCCANLGQTVKGWVNALVLKELRNNFV